MPPRGPIRHAGARRWPLGCTEACHVSASITASRPAQRPTGSSFQPRLERLEDRLAPAILVVTTHADPVTPLKGLLSLREAISLANAAKTPDTIILGAGLYKIGIAGAGENNNATGDFDLMQSMTIQGQGAGITTVDGAGLDRVFDVLGTINVTFADMSLRHGGTSQTDGGAIQALTANLRVSNCQLSDNVGVQGGAIDDQSGNVTLNGSTVSRNVSQTAGGGIFVGGTLTLTHAVVRDNIAGSVGGGIDAVTAKVTGSTINDNSAAQGDGGIDASNNLELGSSTVSGNSSGGAGGGIGTNGLLMAQCTVADNTALTYGGGISAGGIYALNCTVSDNDAAMFDGGGIYTGGAALSSCTIAGNSAGRDGGGFFLFTQNGSAGGAMLAACTISDNAAVRNGGGFYGFGGTPMFVNTTISDNRALGLASASGALGGGGILASLATLDACTVNGNLAAADGGGIWSTTADLTNSTLSGNAATGLGGGIFTNTGSLTCATIAENSASQGGGVYQNAQSPVLVQSTIIALNLVSFGGAGPDVDGLFNSAGHNLIGILDSAVASGFSNGLGDQLGSPAKPLEPGLSAFGNHGGATQTYALLPNSRAIDSGGNPSVATITAAVTPTTTSLTVSDMSAIYPGMLLRLGNEVVRVNTFDPSTNTITVQRGVARTRAAPHVSGTDLAIASDQRGALRPDNGDSPAVVDVGAFEL